MSLDLIKMNLLRSEFYRQIRVMEEENVRRLDELTKLAEEIKNIVNDLEPLELLPLVENVDYELVSNGFAVGRELYSSPAGELNVDNDVVPSEVHSEEYNKWLIRAISIAKKKYPDARFVSVWNDAGYRVYSDMESVLEDSITWTYKLNSVTSEELNSITH